MAETAEAGALPAPRRYQRTRAARVRELSELVSHLFPTVLAVILVALIALVAIKDSRATAGGQLKNGIELGAVYALIAVGYTMVYGIIELINFAHGDVFTLSAVYAILLSQGFGYLGFDINSLATSGAPGFFIALLILLITTGLAAGITGVLIERIAYRPLRNQPRVSALITAIGVSFGLEGVILVTRGSATFRTGKQTWVHGDAFAVGGVTVSWKDIFVVAAALALMVTLQAFVRGTRLGKAMRATAQDRDAALLSGININRTISATFFIGSALAAAGAIIYSLKEDIIVWNLGFRFGIIAFTAAVLGGIGNIVGAGLGGFLIGLISVFGSQLIGPEWANSIVFAMLIIVLTFRPVGLLGMRVPDRA